jgi:RimJ/RimL family protein N-acetyltransferase
MTTPDFRVQRLGEAHADAYRALMLDAYEQAPDAFTSTRAEREAMPREGWLKRMGVIGDSEDMAFGALLPDGRLAGTVTLEFEQREKTRHKASLIGLYVAPSHRGSGVSRALVNAVLHAAAAHRGTLLVRLTVTAGNAPAERLYASCGFVPFGTEPMAIRVGDRFLDKVHMWCDLRERAARSGGSA